MKRIISLLLTVVTLVIISLSCKKTQHTTNPTPDNYRLLSFTKAVNGVYPNDNYRFYYDSRNRISEILYTTNNEPIVMGVGLGKRAVFSYSNDTIYKVISDVQTKVDVEKDTFIRNTSNQIITAYMPGRYINFEYYGKLLVRVTENYYSGDVAIGASKIFKSNNGDFLSQEFDGNLTATFASVFTPPITVEWITATATTTHTATSNTDVLTGYKGEPVTVKAADEFSHTGTNAFAGGVYATETYGVFPDKALRPGDYRQLQSIFTFGVNIYEGAHLTKSISNPLFRTDITYEIDADSKITSLTAITKNVVAKDTTSEVYKVMYETF